MAYRLFLDDERMPAKKDNDMLVVRTVEDAVYLITGRGCPSFISFDHDLGNDVKSGLDLVKWLIDRDLDANGMFMPPDFDFFVHSQNPVGATNINGLLRGYLEFRKNKT